MWEAGWMPLKVPDASWPCGANTEWDKEGDAKLADAQKLWWGSTPG